MKSFTKSKLKKVAQYMVQNGLVDENDLEFHFMSKVQNCSRDINLPLHFVTIANAKKMILTEMRREFRKINYEKLDRSFNPEAAIESNIENIKLETPTELTLTFSNGQTKTFILTEKVEALRSEIKEVETTSDEKPIIRGNGLFRYSSCGKIFLAENSHYGGVEITNFDEVLKAWHTIQRAINWCDYQIEPSRYFSIPDRGFKTKDLETIKAFKTNLIRRQHANLNTKIIKDAYKSN
jgi:hypothetical protein